MPAAGDAVEVVNAANERLLNLINESGQAFLIHSKVEDQLFLRLALGGFGQGPEHVERVWRLIRECAAQLQQ